MKEIRSRDFTASALILVFLSALFYCYEYILRISPNVMMPDIMRQFGLTAAGAGWLISMYYFAYTPLQIVVGVITDRFGAKRVLAWAICFCIAGALVFPATDIIYVAGFGRILIGIGSAFAYVGALAIANRTLHKDWFTFFAGAVTTLGMIGALGGDMGMSYLISHYHWTHILHLAAAAGAGLLIAFLIAVYFNKRSTGEKKEPRVQSISFVTLKNVILNKRFILLGSIGALLFLSLDIFAELWGPQFIHVARGTSIEHATWISGLIFWGWAVGSPCQALFYKYLKTARRCFLLESLLAAICITLAMLFIKSNLLILECLLFLFGFFCSVEVVCFSVATQWVNTKSAATAIAVINFFVMLSGMIFQPLVSEILNWGWHISHKSGPHIYSYGDFHTALMIIPLATAGAFFLSFLLPKDERAHEKIA
jgi:MFS family permease